MSTVLVQKIDDVRVTRESSGLHHVHVHATHNSSATSPRLAPMPSGNLETLTLGLYVDEGPMPVITPVEAKLDLTGFRRVCVRGRADEKCADVPS